MKIFRLYSKNAAVLLSGNSEFEGVTERLLTLKNEGVTEKRWKFLDFTPKMQRRYSVEKNIKNNKLVVTLVNGTVLGGYKRQSKTAWEITFHLPHRCLTLAEHDEMDLFLICL